MAESGYAEKRNPSREDTIAAAATAMSAAGIGIIRVSGPDAVRICAGLYVNAKGEHDLISHAANTISYGYITDAAGNRVDEVMVSVFYAPRSYTTEDTVEINSHGGMYLMGRILDLVLKAGARLAEPGEFTKRAFLGGRIDLSRAEAVMDLIASQNEFARKTALAQLEGSVCGAVQELRAKILYEMAFIESALDDPDTYAGDLDGYPDRLDRLCREMQEKMEGLLETGEKGEILRDGIRTAIIGRPNAGKSSLLNSLTGTERAIVTEIEGTTRDTLEESVRVGGVQLRLADTAGIRDTADPVEKIGIAKTKEAVFRSELVLYILDAAAGITPEDLEIAGMLLSWKEEIPSIRKCILLLNKNDLPAVADTDAAVSFFPAADGILSCSMKTGEGLDRLGGMIGEMYQAGELAHQEEPLLTNARHREAVRGALQSLSLVREGIRAGMSEDFLAIDLMDAYASLGKILGEAVEDDLVEEIFSRFCMGK
ncbi:MAG: tRNA uridine-5-carboxymethylaminomethyl(34) synthesis GTPase MnmE [Eubacteriales bacterium]|nr:tRNA uridine-5-carboxymethylaminomethyl(34) synthesis GTPase MnmE [Eubacteriales bacterium]